MFKEGAGRVLRPFLVVLCASYHMVLPIGADEPMGHQIIHEKLIGNLYKVTSNSGIRFGSFSYSEMQTYTKGVHGSADAVPGKSINAGANFGKKIEEKKRLKQYIFVGSIKVEIIGEAPG